MNTSSSTAETMSLADAVNLASNRQQHPDGTTWVREEAYLRLVDEIVVLEDRWMGSAWFQPWVLVNWNRLGHDRSQGPDTDVRFHALRDLYIMGLGIGGEAGEVQELLKKHVRDGVDIRDKLRLELGDVLHYLARIASAFDMSLDEIMLANKAKMEARYAKREARAKEAPDALLATT